MSMGVAGIDRLLRRSACASRARSEGPLSRNGRIKDNSVAWGVQKML
jgi:hypothetical protein